MNGEARRQALLTHLQQANGPVSGSTLAELLHVSRQVIVQDIALLKASQHTILSTSTGYLIHGSSDRRRVFKVKHSTEEIGDELRTIIDAGGWIVDVFVRHKMYGEIRADLSLRSRGDVEDFVEQLRQGRVQPLKQLTDDFHYHTVGADSEMTLDRIQKELQRKGYLSE